MQAIRYASFDPTACGFPRPRVPFLPGLSLGALRRATSSTYSLLGADQPQRYYRRGRYALLEAYRASGIGDGTMLLAPAYHCRTMLDPAIRLGAIVRLYPVDQRLAPDLEALGRIVRFAVPRACALLLTHYFGFAQDAGVLSRWCEQHGIALIEDCAHAYIVPHGSGRIGRAGQYVTASPYKFFPCEDGGTLIAGNSAELPNTRPMSLAGECRSMAAAFLRGWSQRPVRPGSPVREALADEWTTLTANPGRCGVEHTFESTEPSPLYDPKEEDRASSMASRWIVACCDVDRAAQRRRSHYRRWREALRGLPACRPLYDELPDDCVPYMFPMLIEDPSSQFHLLKRLGVPIWRWDDLAEADCAVSRHYRTRLLQLPCHQSLSDREMDWMIEAVRLTAGRGVRGLSRTNLVAK